MKKTFLSVALAAFALATIVSGIGLARMGGDGDSPDGQCCLCGWNSKNTTYTNYDPPITVTDYFCNTGCPPLVQ